MPGKYRLYSMSGRQIFAAPWTLRRAALRRYQPSTPKRAAYRWLVGASMLIGADRLLSRTIEGPLPLGDGLDLELWLDQMRCQLGAADLEVALFWPPQVERARVYVHLFDARKPVGFAKIALAESNNDALEREERTLRALEQQRLEHCRVPRVLAAGHTPGTTNRFLVLQPLPIGARPITRRVDAYPEQAAQEYAGASRRVESDQVQHLSWWQRYSDSLDERCALFDGELVGLLEHGVDVCRAHGDLGSANLVRDEGALWIFDWEESCPDAPVQTDVLGFAMSMDFRAVLADPQIGVNALKQQHLAHASRARRLDVMMALAFRHTANIGDATAIIHHWDQLQ